MTILQTSRLRLVPYRQSDIDSLYAIMRDPRVMQHIGKGPMSRDEVCQLVDRVEKTLETHRYGLVDDKVEKG
jgi:RimJ/RimL family protein N-acetyltransferase